MTTPSRSAPNSFEELISLAAAKAQGKRPSYAENSMTDHLVSMIAVLATELSVARERNDTIERLLEAKGVLNREEIENFIPEKRVGRERQQESLAFATRLLRSLLQEVEGLQSREKTAEQMVEELKS